jgi:hypothetical protein
MTYTPSTTHAPVVQVYTQSLSTGSHPTLQSKVLEQDQAIADSVSNIFKTKPAATKTSPVLLFSVEKSDSSLSAILALAGIQQ